MTAIEQLFDRASAEYDAGRRSLVPGFDAFYGAALAAVGPLPPGARVLDVGAGTGLLSGLMAAREPSLSVVMIDLAAEMLARAQARFAALGANPPEIIVADFAQTLPPGPFDAVVSALAIHHLEDRDKRRLFARIREVLRPGGRFVNAEQVAGESPAEDRALDRAWEAEARSLGATDAMIEAARARMVHDRCATLAAQLDWLRAAGFTEVTTHWQGGRFATYSATRP